MAYILYKGSGKENLFTHYTININALNRFIYDYRHVFTLFKRARLKKMEV